MKREKKENVIIALLSIASVLIGMVIAFIESIILINNGMPADGAFIASLYSGFILWIIVDAFFIVPAILDKLVR